MDSASSVSHSVGGGGFPGPLSQAQSVHSSVRSASSVASHALAPGSAALDNGQVHLTPIDPGKVSILRGYHGGNGPSVYSKAEMKQGVEGTADKVDSLFHQIISAAIIEHGEDVKIKVVDSADDDGSSSVSSPGSVARYTDVKVDLSRGIITYTDEEDGEIKTITIDMSKTGEKSANGLRKELLDLIKANSDLRPDETDFSHGHYNAKSTVRSFDRGLHTNLQSLPTTFDAAAKAHLGKFLESLSDEDVETALCRIAYAQQSKHKAIEGLKGEIKRVEKEIKDFKALLPAAPVADSPQNKADLDALEEKLAIYQEMLKEFEDVDDFALMTAACLPKESKFEDASRLLIPLVGEDRSWAKTLRMRPADYTLAVQAGNVEGTKQYVADVAAIAQRSYAGMVAVAEHSPSGAINRPPVEAFLLQMADLATDDEASENSGLQFAMLYLSKEDAQRFIDYVAIREADQDDGSSTTSSASSSSNGTAPGDPLRDAIETGLDALINGSQATQGIPKGPFSTRGNPLTGKHLTAFLKLCAPRSSEYGDLHIKPTQTTVAAQAGSLGSRSRRGSNASSVGSHEGAGTIPFPPGPSSVRSGNRRGSTVDASEDDDAGADW